MAQDLSNNPAFKEIFNHSIDTFEKSVMDEINPPLESLEQQNTPKEKVVESRE